MKENRFLLMLCAIVLLFCSPSLVLADDNWPAFRGNGSGIASAKDLPTRWSPDQNVAWGVEIPGYGQSSPVIWKGTVYVTSTEGPFQENAQVHAFDLATGKKRWTHSIKTTVPVENYFRNSRAAPTCSVDEDAVYSFFASGDVTATSHDGKLIWTLPLIKQFGDVDNERGVASSLAQTDDHLFVVIDHHGPSYIVSIDKGTGKISWKTDRGVRVPSWSSPVIARQAGKEWVIISSSDTVDGYDAITGTRVWQIDGLQGNHIPSATVVENRIYVGSTTMYGGVSDPDEVAGSNCCLELTQTDGKPSCAFRWSAQKANSYYSSPLAFAGYVYYVNKVGVLYCINQQTGEQVFAKRIGNPCWASAIGVDSNDEKLVYFFLKNGSTVILRPGDQYDQVARNRLWDASTMADAAKSAAAQRKANTVPADQAKPKTGPERVFAGLPEKQLHQMFSYGDPTVYGVAAIDGNLILRTGQHLYCVRND